MNNSLPQSIKKISHKMKLVEVDREEFESIIRFPYHCYNKTDFNELNKYKCDRVYYWLFKSSKIRLGLICGLTDEILSSPYSAPFGGLSFLDQNIKVKYIEEAIDLLINKCNEERWQLKIKLPPLFYNKTFISKSKNCLYRKGFEIDNIELNHFYTLENFDDNYLNTISKKARTNLKKSFNFDINFYNCQDEDEKKEAYEIIKIHHEAKGYPLWMSWDQVKATSSVIPADFFILKDSDSTAIASAIVFHVAEQITQIIYWGSLQKYNLYRPMNYLSYKIFEYYKNIDYRYIDLGPSTYNSAPNHGLCEFKENIGCTLTPRFSFKYDPSKGLQTQII